MSQLQVNRINDSSGGVLAPISSVMRNRIINGAMVIDQRNAGASVTANNAVFGVDRFTTLASVSSKLNVQQNAGAVTPPAGFTNYLGYTSTSAYSVGAGEVFATSQNIEGLNVSDLGWGTANAKTVTLSFWVRSSLTGTFSGFFTNADSTRSYVFSYTINAANTWEYKTITIAGDTTGTWLTTNGRGIRLFWTLAAGSSLTGTAGSWVAGDKYGVTGTTSVVGTNGATFYITGCQLEVGTQATSFEYRQYGTELALCQRYGIPVYSESLVFGYVNVANTWSPRFATPVQMRATPTVTGLGSGGMFASNDHANNIANSTPTITLLDGSQYGVRLSISGMAGGTTNTAYGGVYNAAYRSFAFLSAEL